MALGGGLPGVPALEPPTTAVSYHGEGRLFRESEGVMRGGQEEEAVEAGEGRQRGKREKRGKEYPRFDCFRC